MTTLPARKRHHVIQQMPLPTGVVDEQGVAGTYVDSDTGEWVATYRPGAASGLRDLCLSLWQQPIYGISPETFPTQLQPWVDLAAVGAGCAGLITTNAPETPVHWDSWTEQGHVDGRSTCLVVYRDGAFTGGDYVLAEYGIAFDMQDGDLLLTPTKVLHGNVQRVGDGYNRHTVVLCLDGHPAA